jgi:hypothetical protein
MQNDAAATLFCHLLLNLEQEQNMVSSKAKKKTGEGYQLNPKDVRHPLRQATTFLLPICGITCHFGTEVVVHKMICHLGYILIKAYYCGSLSTVPVVVIFLCKCMFLEGAKLILLVSQRTYTPSNHYYLFQIWMYLDIF